MTASERIREAREYYALCREAEELGVPVSLDDPRSPRTTEGLRIAVRAALDEVSAEVES